MNVKPIGSIHSPFVEAEGTPIQASMAQGAEGVVHVFPEFVEGLKDLDGFERIWLVYWFHRALPAQLTVTPFMDDHSRGLFATRAPCRPNPIGMSCVRLLRIEGGDLHVADVDVLDGTPLLDIKPYVSAFDRFEVSRTGWLEQKRPPAAGGDSRFTK